MVIGFVFIYWSVVTLGSFLLEEGHQGKGTYLIWIKIYCLLPWWTFHMLSDFFFFLYFQEGLLIGIRETELRS